MTPVAMFHHRSILKKILTSRVSIPCPSNIASFGSRIFISGFVPAHRRVARRLSRSFPGHAVDSLAKVLD
jgi:hypothetical protein